MKKLTFVLLFAISLAYWNGSSGYKRAFKQKTTQQVNDALTSDDRKNYVVSISQQSIGKPVSTSTDPEFPSNMLRISLDLKVSNNSNDTLKYLNKSCAWSDILKTNNMKMHIMANYCSTDVTKVAFVAPHKSMMFKLFIIYNKTKVNTNTPFKIGVGIFKFVNKKQLLAFNPAKTFDAANTTNLIWSNTVLIPQ